MSAVPPAGQGEMSVTALSGKFWARNCDDAAAMQRPKARKTFVRRFMSPLRAEADAEMIVLFLTSVGRRARQARPPCYHGAMTDRREFLLSSAGLAAAAMSARTIAAPARDAGWNAGAGAPLIPT